MVLIQGAILCVVICLIYKRFLCTIFSPKSRSLMPGPKVPFLSIFGVLGALPSRATMKRMSLSSPSYILQLLCGLAILFPKEKVLRLRIGVREIIFAVKPEAVQDLMCNSAQSTMPLLNIIMPWLGDTLITSYGEKWKLGKKIMMTALNYKNLQVFIPKLDEMSKTLVNTLKSTCHEDWIDVVEPVERCMMDIASKAMLGIVLCDNDQDHVEFRKTMLRVQATLTERLSNPILQVDFLYKFSNRHRQFQKDMSYIRNFVMEIIKEKKKTIKKQIMNNGNYSDEESSKNTGFLDRLIQIEMDNPAFTEKNVQRETISFLFGGYDTTSVGLQWALYLIGLYPEIQDKIHKELQLIFGADQEREVTGKDLKRMVYLECVIKESLRLYPSVPFAGKTFLEDFDLCGYRVKKDTTVLYSQFQLHRNPDVFPDPEKFDPDRFLQQNSVGRSPYAYVPFGNGERHCLGKRFATTELTTVIANVVRNFSLKSLERRDKIFLSAVVTLHPACPLKVRFTPRQN